MKILLNHDSFEKLIGQIVHIEENLQLIHETAEKNGAFKSIAEATLFFNEYIQKTERLFGEISVEGKESRIPFIVLNSLFTLKRDEKEYRCRMSRDHFYGRDAVNIFFLSRDGIALLLKKENENVTVDMGDGAAEYKISAIRI